MGTYEVNILGQRYKVRSEDDEEYVNKLAEYLDEQLDEVRKNTKIVASQNLAVLAGLNIVDTLFKQKEKDAQFKKDIREKIRKMVRLVRAGIEEKS